MHLALFFLHLSQMVRHRALISTWKLEHTSAVFDVVKEVATVIACVCFFSDKDAILELGDALFTVFSLLGFLLNIVDIYTTPNLRLSARRDTIRWGTSTLRVTVRSSPLPPRSLSYCLLLSLTFFHSRSLSLAPAPAPAPALTLTLTLTLSLSLSLSLSLTLSLSLSLSLTLTLTLTLTLSLSLCHSN